MKTIIYVPDIECDSCVKLLERSFKNKEGINSFKIKEDYIEFEFNENLIKKEQLINLIKKQNFRASFTPFERKNWSERIRHYKENKHKYKIEQKIITYTLGIFLTLLILEVILYLTLFKDIPNFIQNYGWWIFYLNISISVISLGTWHFFAYRAKYTCMTGMMIGMTFGMQTGMMLGAVLGATNGFFIGAMAGMLLGTFIGIITGKCCGVMGIMEGMMAGVMGGTMGSMISVMMFSDHLLYFMPFYMVINIIIMWGLSYMLYEEVVEDKDVIKKPTDFITVAIISIIAAFILLAIMIYGPKSFLINF